MKRFVLLCLSCLALVAVAPAYGGARPALTKEHAEIGSNIDAQAIWKGSSAFDRCTGPYENGHGKTQWACYGRMTSGGHVNQYWQINLDAYEEVTFDRLCGTTTKCPGA